MAFSWSVLMMMSPDWWPHSARNSMTLSAANFPVEPLDGKTDAIFMPVPFSTPTNTVNLYPNSFPRKQ